MKLEPLLLTLLSSSSSASSSAFAPRPPVVVVFVVVSFVMEYLIRVPTAVASHHHHHGDGDSSSSASFASSSLTAESRRILSPQMLLIRLHRTMDNDNGMDSLLGEYVRRQYSRSSMFDNKDDHLREEVGHKRSHHKTRKTKKRRISRRNVETTGLVEQEASTSTPPSETEPTPSTGETRTELELEQCEVAYMERISHHCRYPGKLDPCYADGTKSSDAVASTTTSTTTVGTATTEKQQQKSTTSTPAISTMLDLRVTAKRCCTERCHLSQLERLCCRKPDCLRQCYGPMFFSDGQPKTSDFITGSATNEARRGATGGGARRTFRYLSLLAQPNPIRRRHKPMLSEEALEMTD